MNLLSRFFSKAHPRSSKTIHRKALPVRTYLLLIVLACVSSGADAQTWTGGAGNRLWSSAGNWSGGVPNNGSGSVEFSSSPGLVNVDTAFTFGSSQNSQFLLNSSSAGGGFSFEGSPISFTAGTVQVTGSGNSFTSGIGIFGLMTLNGDRVVISDVAGSGDLTVNGWMALSDDYTATGDLRVNGIMTMAGGEIANSAPGGEYRLNGGQLLGHGTIDRFSRLSGFVTGSGGSLRFNQNGFLIGASFGGDIELNSGWTTTNNSSFSISSNGVVSGTGSLNLTEGLANNGEVSLTGGINVTSGGFIEGGQVNGTIHSQITSQGTIGGNTFTGSIRSDGGIISDGTFTGSVESSAGEILGGNFSGDVTLIRGRVRGGSFETVIVDSNSGTPSNSVTQFDGNNIAVNNLLDIQSGFLIVGAGIDVAGTGQIEIASGGNLVMNGSTSLDITLFQGGSIQGNGNISGNIVSSGELAPGNSAGTLGIDGSIDLSDTSTVCTELGGTIAGTQYDQILGSGIASSSVMLDGFLDVQFIDSFVADSIDEFFIIQDMAISGRFLNTPGDLILTDQGRFNIEYGADFVRLYNLTAVPEPSSMGLLLASSLVIASRRKRKLPVV